MKTIKLIFLSIGFFTNIFSQDANFPKAVKNDTTHFIKRIINYWDVDSMVNATAKDLDSLLNICQFKNPSIKNNLIANAKIIKDYIEALIENGGFDKMSDISSPNQVYDFKYMNSTLSAELVIYVQSIRNLDIKESVKQRAISRLAKMEDMSRITPYTHKYNPALTILKDQLQKVIRSEIYIVVKENMNE